MALKLRSNIILLTKQSEIIFYTARTTKNWVVFVLLVNNEAATDFRKRPTFKMIFLSKNTSQQKNHHMDIRPKHFEITRQKIVNWYPAAI